MTPLIRYCFCKHDNMYSAVSTFEIIVYACQKGSNPTGPSKVVQITESYMCSIELFTGTLNAVGVGVTGNVGGRLGVGVVTTRFSI